MASDPIHIKESRVGSFTAAANAHKEGVQAYAHDVVNDPHASEAMKKKAQFAINASHWNH
jgi:hypothetical protein